MPAGLGAGLGGRTRDTTGGTTGGATSGVAGGGVGLITGATGFMGKVLVEKLLRSCPGIDRVYLLLRPYKGKDVTSRLQELINNEV